MHKYDRIVATLRGAGGVQASSLQITCKSALVKSEFYFPIIVLE